MERDGLAVDQLSNERVSAFLAEYRRDRFHLPSASVWPLLEYLRAQGAVAPESPRALTPVEQLVDEYRDWLRGERGLAPSTVRGSARLARRFLTERACPGDPHDVHGITAAEVNGFLLRECARVSTGTAGCCTYWLRSLLRYLAVRGLADSGLADAVPRVVRWREATIPQFPPRSTSTGFSPHAIATNQPASATTRRAQRRRSHPHRRRLSRDAVERRVTTHVATATTRCPSLKGQTSPPPCLCRPARYANLDETVLLRRTKGPEGVGINESALRTAMSASEVGTGQAFRDEHIGAVDRLLLLGRVGVRRTFGGGDFLGLGERAITSPRAADRYPERDQDRRAKPLALCRFERHDYADRFRPSRVLRFEHGEDNRDHDQRGRGRACGRAFTG
jgi:hypothetical protein